MTTKTKYFSYSNHYSNVSTCKVCGEEFILGNSCICGERLVDDCSNVDTCKVCGVDRVPGNPCRCGEQMVDALDKPKRQEGDICKETGGMKDVVGKPVMDQLPWEMMEEFSRVYEFGNMNKYEKGNWRKGYEYTRSAGAIIRHFTNWYRGQDNDPEAMEKYGLEVSQLMQIAWHCFTLAYFQKYNVGIDDRPVKDLDIDKDAPF